MKSPTLKIITPCYEKHIGFLYGLSDKIRESCNVAGVYYDHLIDTNKCYPGLSRNKLLDWIKDEDYVAFMDSDDYPLKPWAKEIYSCLKYHDVVYGDYIEHETGKIHKSRVFDYELFLKQDFIPFSTVAMRGYIANKIRFKPIQKAEDWVFLHETYKITKDFFYLAEPLVVRRTKTSINRSYIPIYRKLKRLYKDYKARQIIKSL